MLNRFSQKILGYKEVDRAVWLMWARLTSLIFPCISPTSAVSELSLGLYSPQHNWCYLKKKILFSNSL